VEERLLAMVAVLAADRLPLRLRQQRALLPLWLRRLDAVSLPC